MVDTYSNGVQCIVEVLRPKGKGWVEIPLNKRYSLGYPSRAFRFAGICVISAVEVATEPGMDKGFEYHISISKQFLDGRKGRCDSTEAKWVLDQFGLDGAEEDNHVPHGFVRNFWRPVANSLVGIECPCKESEPEIREDKGDFVWRP